MRLYIQPKHYDIVSPREQEANVKTYIEALNASVEREREQREQRARETVQQMRERLAPVEDRLSRLLAAIPREVQSGGLSLPALRSALRGRWRGSAHPGDVGALGFMQQARERLTRSHN